MQWIPYYQQVISMYIWNVGSKFICAMKRQWIDKTHLKKNKVRRTCTEIKTYYVKLSNWGSEPLLQGKTFRPMEYNWSPETTPHTKGFLIYNKLALQSNGEKNRLSTNGSIIMGIHI